MTTRMTTRAVYLGLLLGSSTAPLAVQAQTASAEPLALEEIVITAERRVEKLDQVPIAATVVNGTELAEHGVSTIDDLVSQSPALNVQNQGMLAYVNIRGVGLQSTNPTTSSGVANYSDGFFIPHETAISDSYYDIAQIEILRGPQGTLVGQSSTGGAILVNSMKPSVEKITGYAQQTFGSYRYTKTEGAVNLPLTDQLAVRVAQHIDHKDSFYTSLPIAFDASTPAVPPGPPVSQPTGATVHNGQLIHAQEPGNKDSSGGRVGIKWLPNSAVDEYLKYEYETKKSDGFVGKNYYELQGVNDSFSPLLRQPRVISYDTPEFTKYSFSRVTNEINWDLSEYLKLRSLTGYQHEQLKNLFDDDFSYQSVLAPPATFPFGGGPPPGFPYSAAVATQLFKEDTIEQELNLISNSSGALNWIVGAFYLQDRAPTYLDYDAKPFPPPHFTIRVKPFERTYALFGNVKYKFTDQWQLEVGARENRYEKQQTGTVDYYGAFNPFGPPFFIDQPGVSLDAKTSHTVPTGKVAMSFFPNPDSTVFASASRGFKAGGANGGTADLLFKEETVNSYEVGYKGTLLDRKLRISSSAFYYDYKNMQVTSTDASNLREIINVPKAKIYGAELELTGQVGSMLVLNAGGGYTNAKVAGALSLVDPENPPGGPVDLTGRRLGYAPKWTANGGGTLTVPVDMGKIAFTAQYSYTDQTYTTLFQHPWENLDGHSLVNLNLALLLNNGVKLEAYSTNVQDKLYAAGTIGANSFIWGAPREYGVRLGINF